tara:strand:+ start:728 stop:955 length:228 start_codon:yes stop_codon:yes gene_type:complete
MKNFNNIFTYWKDWMSVEDKINEMIENENLEGLIYADGYIGTFWYILNQSWYQLNDKFQAKTILTEQGCVKLEDT